MYSSVVTQVGRIDCRLVRSQCNDLHIQKFPTFAVFKSGGGYEIHHGVFFFCYSL